MNSQFLSHNFNFNDYPNIPSNLEYSGSFFLSVFDSICKNFGILQCRLWHDHSGIEVVFAMDTSNTQTIYEFKREFNSGNKQTEIHIIWQSEKIFESISFCSILFDLAKSFITSNQQHQPRKNGESISPFLKNQVHFLQRLAKSNAALLISGESGTGKEFLARYIHDIGRKIHPFIILSLAGIPESLFEVELFGYEKGAFTDANEKKAGKFSLAEHGTLVLDNIESLSLFQQAKLLRILQDGSYYPLGSNLLLQIDCRIITLCSIRLDQLVGEGKFREDLYYRLNVIPFFIPPLRERKSDIVFFLNEFIQAHSIDGNEKLIATKQMLQVLLDGQWSGNIRELLNYLEYALINSKNGLLEAVDSTRGLVKHKTLKEGILHYKKNLIYDTLAVCKGNQTQAAKILGIERTYLVRLIKDYCIVSKQE